MRGAECSVLEVLILYTVLAYADLTLKIQHSMGERCRFLRQNACAPLVTCYVVNIVLTLCSL